MEPPKHAGDSVGIDMGCVRFCTLSDGTFFEPCGALKKALKKLARMQRRLARMQKFEKNWRKQKAAIARLHQHIANVRRDFIEKVSLNICKNHAEIFREDLKIKNMTASAKGTVEEHGTRVAQKSGLNRSILDQGWRIFFSKLDWKALRLGGHVRCRRRYKSHLPDMRLCFQRQSQDASVVQMRFLRTSGKRGRRGCDQHQRARTKLVSLWGV